MTITAADTRATLPATQLQAAQPINVLTPYLAAFLQSIDRSEKTQRTYLINLKQFFAYIEYAGIESPVHQDIINYRKWLESEHDAIIFAPDTPNGWKYRTDHSGNIQRITCKANTVKQYLQSVKQFYKWAESMEYCKNIAANVHTPKIIESHRKDSLTAHEVLTIEISIADTAAAREAAAATAQKDRAGQQQRSEEQGKRLRAIYLLAVNAGLRTIEISRANVRDLQRKGNTAYLLVHGKGQSEAATKKPIAQEVYNAIQDYLKCRSDRPTGSSPLFAATGNRSGGQRIATTTISKMLKAAMIEAGFNSERLTAHSLRHTAGQNVMQITGDNIYQTQQYMRHRNPKTTEIYLENNAAEQNADIAARLYNHYHGAETSSAPSSDSKAEQLKTAAGKLSPAQIEQLISLIATMPAAY